MIVSSKIFKDEMIKIISEDAKVSDNVVKLNKEKVSSLFDTIGAISCLSGLDVNIKANDGLIHSLDEYSLDNRLAPLALPRDVKVISSENAESLRPIILHGPKGLVKGELDTVITYLDDLGNVESVDKFDKQIAAKYVREGASRGDVVLIDNHSDKDVLTPSGFQEAQSILFSWFKSDLGSCTSMRELTKPVLLMDVIDRIDNGFNTLSTIQDSMSLPITLKCVHDIYKDYMYNYPLKAYYREFAAHFVVNNLCVKPNIVTD